LASVTEKPTPPHSFPTRFRDPIALLVAVSVALSMRLSGLSEWWLNPDEGIYYSILTRADFSGFWQEVVANAHPPLYYLLLRGLGVFTWDFFWFRMFSVGCGIVAVVAVWAIARELGGEGVRGSVAAFLSALLLALAPGAIDLSQVMRPYMLQLALLSGALLFLLRYRTDLRWRPLVGFSTLTSLALLTHYSSVLAYGVFGLLVLRHAVDPETDRTAWRRLAGAQVVPIGVIAALYFLHLRPLAGSALAGEALGGWLSPYMIDSVGDAWLSVLGFQHLLAGPWLRGPFALLLLASIGLSAYLREFRVAVMVAGALLVALAAAALGAYPFGSTRHSAWLMTFLVPALGWSGATLLTIPLGRWIGVATTSTQVRMVGAGAVMTMLLFAAGGPIGDLVGAPQAPWAPPDRVLRQGNLTQMIDALDPSSGPELMLMSAQTFYLLLPFYPEAREEARYSTDGTVSHFSYGDREVVVSTAWDFSMETGTPAPGDLGRFVTTALDAFPDLDLETRSATLLVGGWRPGFVDELRALAADEPFLRTSESVPGLFAFGLEMAPLISALR
jgi:dolichyl-phosphate-mannose-protein mannosyltransferase